MPRQRPARKAAAPSASAAVMLGVRVQPRASRNEAALQPDGSLKVRLTAPPVDGAANEALVKFLADTFSVSRSQVELVSGQTGRQKIVRISGINSGDIERVLKAKGE